MGGTVGKPTPCYGGVEPTFISLQPSYQKLFPHKTTLRNRKHPYTLCGTDIMRCVVCSVEYLVCSIQYRQYAVCSIQCVVSGTDSMQCIVCSVQYAVCSMWYRQYAVCSIKRVQWGLKFLNTNECNNNNVTHIHKLTIYKSPIVTLISLGNFHSSLCSHGLNLYYTRRYLYLQGDIYKEICLFIHLYYRGSFAIAFLLWRFWTKLLLCILARPKSRTAQSLSKPLSECSIIWKSGLLNYCFYNEAWFEFLFLHFQYCWDLSPTGLLSNLLPVWPGHLQCVMFWSWGYACISFQHTGGVSNHILSTHIYTFSSSLYYWKIATTKKKDILFQVACGDKTFFYSWKCLCKFGQHFSHVRMTFSTTQIFPFRLALFKKDNVISQED